MQGDVKFFNRTKGFGFITNTEDGNDYFVHESTIENPPLRDGDRVEFEATEGDKGPRAEKVKKIEAPPSMGRTELNDASVQL